MFTDIINKLKKLFGVNSIGKSELQHAQELGYVINYENISEFNIVSIIANKLSNLVCSDSSAEVIINSGSASFNNRIDFLNQSLQKCFCNINLISTRAFGIGGVILKPYIYNNQIYTDILPQNRFFVIEQHGEVITKAGFIADILPDSKSKKRKFLRIEYHSIDIDSQSGESIYTIQNKAIVCDSGSGYKDGKEISLSDSPWNNLAPSIKISNVDKMLFAFVKCPTDNKKEFSMSSGQYVTGVPITYGQDKIIKMILDLLNEVPDEYKNKKAFIGADDLMFDRNNKLPESGLYKLFRGVGAIDQKAFWEVFSPEIRHTAYFDGLDYLLGLLEKSICVNKGVLTDLNVSNATATAIKRSTLDTFATVHAMRRNIEKAFEHLVYAYDVIADAFNLTESQDNTEYTNYSVKFDWDYRLLEDTSETWKQLLEGYNAGAVTLEELRMYLFNEDRHTAKAINPENPKDSDDLQICENGENDAVIRRQLQIVDSDLQSINPSDLNPSDLLPPIGRNYSDTDDAFNPFDKDSWNMAEQSKIYRNSPDIARYLASEACKKIF